MKQQFKVHNIATFSIIDHMTLALDQMTDGGSNCYRLLDSFSGPKLGASSFEYTGRVPSEN